MSRKYSNPKIAICGIGRWGSNHLRVFSELIGKENVIAYDSSPTVLSSIATSGKATIARNIDEAIEMADAVVVSTPATTHADIAKKAIDGYRPVFIEKPMTMNEISALNIGKSAKVNDVIVAVDHILLHHPAIPVIKEKIDSGIIGDVLYVDTERTNFGWRVFGEDVINSLMIHDVYIVEYLFGNIVSVDAAIGTRDARGPMDDDYDDVTAIIRTENGVRIRMHSSWSTARKQRYMSIIGSAGTIEWNDSVPGKDSCIIMSDKYIDRHAEILSPATVTSDIKITWSEPLKNAAQNFIDCLYSGDRPLCSSEDGARAVRMVAAIRRGLK